MASLLEDLYWGNIKPEGSADQDLIRRQRDIEEYQELYEKFRSLLSSAAEEAYEEMSAWQNRAEGDREAKLFAGGFQLGARLMAEVFRD